MSILYISYCGAIYASSGVIGAQSSANLACTLDQSTMKYIFVGLAFCACIYIGLGCLAQYMGEPQTGPLPWSFVAFRSFGAWCTFCCFLALIRAIPAAILCWTGAVAYSLLSWKLNASWVFHDELLRFDAWPPVFLTLAAWTERPLALPK